MTNEQLYLAIGVPLIVNFAGLAGLYALIKSELRRIEQKIDFGFANMKLELKLHEALHHPEIREKQAQ